MAKAKMPMVDVEVCFYLLDGSPTVGLFHRDADGFGYCGGFLVAEPDGRPVLNVDEYRLATVRVAAGDVDKDGWPRLVARLADRMVEIINEHEEDWGAQNVLFDCLVGGHVRTGRTPRMEVVSHVRGEVDVTMTDSGIVAFAKAQGWDGARKMRRRFLGCEVWEGVLEHADPANPPAVGLPLVILVDGDVIRAATVDETFAWMGCRSDGGWFSS